MAAPTPYCPEIEVDLSRFDVELLVETGSPIEVEILQPDVVIEALTVANQGPKGDQGPPGPVGPVGSLGPQGPPGLQGQTGAQGPQGNQGNTGNPGPPGQIGPQGIQGVTGDTGPSGAQGIPGATGSQGPTGPTGATGSQGTPGATGSQGPIGNTGPAGAQGPTGNQGATGQPAYTLSTAGFTVPPIGSSVTVPVTDTSWVALNEILWIADAGGPGVAGAMQVTAKTATSLTLKNIAASTLAVFSRTAAGLTPASGGTSGTTNYLREDGTWTAPASGTGAGDMTKAVYDANADNIVDHAALADTAPWGGITGKPATFPPDVTAELVARKGAVNGYAGLDGTSKVPTAQLPATMAPSAHAAAHLDNGTDVVPVVTATRTGLAPKLSNVASQYLNGTGAWSNPTQGPFDLKAQTVVQSGASLAINRALGENCTLSLTASITAITVTAWPSAGNTGKVRLIVSNTGAFAISGWPAGTIWPGGTAPTITSGAGKKDIILLMSDDGGTTIYGSIVGQDYH